MADFFEWNVSYNLGVAPMDDEHRLIVEAMNLLHQVNESKASAPRVQKAMAQLVQITKEHFADEEAYMEQMGFPDLRKHRHMHVHLLERLGQFHADVRASGVASPELFHFLKMWLKAHICGIDTQYAKYRRVA